MSDETILNDGGFQTPLRGTKALEPAIVAPQTARHEPIAPMARRVLGVLIEKQKTSRSADAYPMTLNSLTTGCNQKSNRDPVLDLTEDDVEETLAELQQRGLTQKIIGGRADRYKHLLYEVWGVSKLEMALLAELLLRGPQTEGDLRGRTGRMEDVPELEELREVLKKLVEKQCVVYITAPDRRGAILSHGFHSPAEIEQLVALHSGASGSVPASATARLTPGMTAVAELEAKLHIAIDEIERLKQRVSRLEDRAGA